VNIAYRIDNEFGPRTAKSLYGDGFMDFIHRPKSKILKIKN
jgi:hypothetical protein